ncbi:MAG TPA: hypothetical protein VH480_09335 [Streptosporangiaceae bacterium]|jgi:hypothetical protein
MSEQDQAPGRADADDVEGHVNYRGSGDQPKVDDAEGHLFRRDGDDTEGHVRTRGGDGDDTEGHVRARGDDGSDDVEGHARHF